MVTKFKEDISYKQELGTGIVGRAVTASLYVSPNGNNSDGSTWANAYNTIQEALDAASTDADDCTAIYISPHATFYDINRTGDPTWSANVILKGTHRLWAPIRNTHAGASSVMKFTGKASLEDLAVFTTGGLNGVVITKSGFRVRHCGFNSELLTSAGCSICIDGSAAFIRGGIMEEVIFLGHKDYTTALYLNTAKINTFKNLNIHSCLKGIHIINAASDQNFFTNIDIGDCDGGSGIGIDIDAGNEQHFSDLYLHHNDINIDDEVGDHQYRRVDGNFPITFEPDDLVGTVSATAGNDTWGDSKVIRAAAAKPFRIVGINFVPSASETYRVRFTDGVTWFDDLMFDVTKREGGAAPSGTEFIFNKGTVISAQAQSVSGGNTVNIWLEVQEI